MKNKIFMKNKTLLSVSLALMVAMPMQDRSLMITSKTRRCDWIISWRAIA